MARRAGSHAQSQSGGRGSGGRSAYPGQAYGCSARIRGLGGHLAVGDAAQHLTPVDRDFGWADETQLHPPLAHLEHLHLDLLADDDGLPGFAAENEHDYWYPFLAPPAGDTPPGFLRSRRLAGSPPALRRGWTPRAEFPRRAGRLKMQEKANLRAAVSCEDCWWCAGASMPRRKAMSPRRPARRFPRRDTRPQPSAGQRPSSPASSETSSRREPQAPGQRLQKVLAAAGVDSRRKCEELILAGRVEVDRQVVRKLGTRVDPARQEIRVDGQVLRPPRLFYYAVYKPPGVVSTNYDRAGRPRVVDLVPSRGARLFTIGRLDLKSEGLILVTNDGPLADLLTHPRYGVPKLYRVLVAGRPEAEVLRRLRRGVHLAEGLVRADEIRVRAHHKQSTVLEIVLSEGRNRELRRMFARLGHKVMKLLRVAIGPVRLGQLAPGQYRPLSAQAVGALRAAAGAKPEKNHGAAAGDVFCLPRFSSPARQARLG